MEYIALILFISIFLFIMAGYSVAFTLGGLSVLAGIIFVPDFLDFLPLRIMGVVQNYVLLSVPLFIYMGLVLEKSGIAEELLRSMAVLFGTLKGGLALSVIVVGTLLAASTGIVGATVITMGLISLPVMLKKGYDKGLATGTIASAGTLGQIIPPSVVLVLLGSVLNISVGDLFRAAIVPGMLLVGAYILYVLIFAHLRPEKAPPLPEAEINAFKDHQFYRKVIKAFLFPIILIVAVLGAIIGGFASPTEAAAVGAMGAMLLSMTQGRLNMKMLRNVVRETSHLTGMVFMILIGATTFALVFRGLGGDHALVHFIDKSNLTAGHFLILVMIVVFIAGFFIDFIEIVFIIVPVVAPIFTKLGIDPVWAGILLALNLQTSFLTPPFGFALFYLKGVAPPEVRTVDLYRGVVPFLVIQIAVLLLVGLVPSLLR
jgi:tripartite ATP-independent transporter DctM subunit